MPDKHATRKLSHAGTERITQSPSVAEVVWSAASAPPLDESLERLFDRLSRITPTTSQGAQGCALDGDCRITGRGAPAKVLRPSRSQK